MTVEQRGQLIRDAADLLSHSFPDPEITEAEIADLYVEFSNVVSLFSDETLQRLVAPGRTPRQLYVLVDWEYLWRSETQINDLLHMMSVQELSQHKRDDIEALMKALGYYELVKPAHGRYPAERADQLKAIVRVTVHMQRNPHNVRGINMEKTVRVNKSTWHTIPYIKDRELRELLLDSASDRDALVNLITTRSLFDAKALKEMVSTVASPLVSGSL
jgi:hypothetical protein